VIAVAILFMFSRLNSAGEPAGGNPAPASGTAPALASPDVTVEITSNQLSAIKIEPVGTFTFPVEREALGNVGFDKDPAEIQAESTLLGAAATAEVTSNELVRAQALYETNGVAQRELEQAISDEQTARSALQSARSAVLALGVTDDEIDHILAAKGIDPKSANASPSKWVLANAVEADGPLLRVGDPVKVSVTALPDRAFEGKVARIYTTIDPNLHRQPFRCEVADPGNELRVGMLASVSVQIADPVESVALPLNGVVREGNGMMTAWVTTDRVHFTQRQIKTGMREDGRVQVLDGLQGDKLVVTDGAIFLDNIVNAVPGD
jgi:cobalt-zinc-cadmium efflux system membrane fusion protein